MLSNPNNTFQSIFANNANPKLATVKSYEMNNFSFLNPAADNEKNDELYGMKQPRETEKGRPGFVEDYETNIRRNLKTQQRNLESLLLKKRLLDITIENIKDDIQLDFKRLKNFTAKTKYYEDQLLQIQRGPDEGFNDFHSFIMPNHQFDDFRKKNLLFLKSEQSPNELPCHFFKSERNSVKLRSQPKPPRYPELPPPGSPKHVMSKPVEDLENFFQFTGKTEKAGRGREESDRRKKYCLREKDDHMMVSFPAPDKYDRSSRYQLTPDNSLSTLLIILRKMMHSTEVLQPELNDLNPVEKTILKAFLVKKKILSGEDEVVFDKDHFNKYYKIKTERRREENLKHVFMMAIKFLKQQFKRRKANFRLHKDDVKKSKKEILELSFYIYYFGSVADQKGWSIERFYQPKVVGAKKNVKTERMKSINQEYVSFVRLSVRFMQHFELYLNDEFVVDKQKLGVWSNSSDMIEEKLISKINQWDQTIQEERKGLDKVISSLSGNIKSKMPWSKQEIICAIQDVKKLFKLAPFDT